MRISDWSSDVCSSDLQWADARIELMNLLKAEPANAGALTLMARIQIASGGGVGAAATLARLGDGAASAELTDMRAEADMLRGQCEIGRASCRERVCQYV